MLRRKPKAESPEEALARYRSEKRKYRARKRLRKIAQCFAKALLLVFVLGCATPTKVVETFTVDTVYVTQDTVYVNSLEGSPFSLFLHVYPSVEPIYHVPEDSFVVVFWYYLTKIDESAIDSVWAQGYVFNEDYSEVWDVSEVYVRPPLGGWVRFAHVNRSWVSAAFNLSQLSDARVAMSIRWGPLQKGQNIIFLESGPLAH